MARHFVNRKIAHKRPSSGIIQVFEPAKPSDKKKKGTCGLAYYQEWN